MNWYFLILREVRHFNSKKKDFRIRGSSNHSVNIRQESQVNSIQQRVRSNGSQIIGSVTGGLVVQAEVLNHYDKENPEVSFPRFFKCPDNIPTRTISPIGREDEVIKLHELLAKASIVSIVDSPGKLGVGKTELAREYAFEYLKRKKYYDGGVVWISCRREKHIAEQISEFFDNLVIPFMENQFNCSFLPENIDIHEKVNLCWKLWPEQSKTIVDRKFLIVVDAVTNPKLILEFLPLDDAMYEQHFKILVTTDRKLGLPFTEMELNTLHPNDSKQLLADLISIRSKHTPSDRYLERVCDLVDHSPKALHLLAPFLKLEE